MLKRWRIQNSLNLDTAAKRIGLAVSTYFEIERGVAFPGPRTIAQIEAATGGAVTVMDHWLAWSAAHPTEIAESRAAGLSAAKPKPTGQKRRPSNG